MEVKIGMSVILKDGRFMKIVEKDEDGTIYGKFNLQDKETMFTIDEILGEVEFRQHSHPIIQNLIRMQMGKKRQSFIVLRYRNDESSGLVSFVSGEELDEKRVLGTIRAAVTGWIIKTIEGKDAWEASRHTFNLGHLAEHLGDPALRIQLAACGLEEFTIEPMSGDRVASWGNGEVLVDFDALNKFMESARNAQEAESSREEPATEVELPENPEWDTPRPDNA